MSKNIVDPWRKPVIALQKTSLVTICTDNALTSPPQRAPGGGRFSYKGESKNQEIDIRLSFPSLSYNISFYEHFENVDEPSPNRLSFIYVGDGVTGVEPYRFRRYDYEVRRIDFSHSLPSLWVLLDIVSQVETCEDVRIIFDPDNIRLSSADESHLSSINNGPDAPKKSLSVKKVVVDTMRPPGITSPEVWSGKTRFETLLELIPSNFPNVESLEITMDAGPNNRNYEVVYKFEQEYKYQINTITKTIYPNVRTTANFTGTPKDTNGNVVVVPQQGRTTQILPSSSARPEFFQSPSASIQRLLVEYAESVVDETETHRTPHQETVTPENQQVGSGSANGTKTFTNGHASSDNGQPALNNLKRQLNGRVRVCPPPPIISKNQNLPQDFQGTYKEFVKMNLASSQHTSRPEPVTSVLPTSCSSTGSNNKFLAPPPHLTTSSVAPRGCPDAYGISLSSDEEDVEVIDYANGTQPIAASSVRQTLSHLDPRHNTSFYTGLMERQASLNPSYSTSSQASNLSDGRESLYNGHHPCTTTSSTFAPTAATAHGSGILRGNGYKGSRFEESEISELELTSPKRKSRWDMGPSKNGNHLLDSGEQKQYYGESDSPSSFNPCNRRYAPPRDEHLFNPNPRSRSRGRSRGRSRDRSRSRSRGRSHDRRRGRSRDRSQGRSRNRSRGRSRSRS